MPPRCTLCKHEKRAEIEKAILRGESYRSIEKRFGVNDSTITKHFRNGHIAKDAKAKRAVEVQERVDDVFAEIDKWRAELARLYEKVKDKENITQALTAIDRVAKLIELLAKLKGQMPPETQINILTNPSFIQMRTVILNALSGFPEARLKVSEVLRNVEDSADMP